MVEKVVCVPEWVTETRTINVTEYKQEQQTKTVTRCKPVMTHQGSHVRSCTVMEPVTKTKTCTYTVCKPVMETKTCDYTVCVPVYKDVEKTYTVWFRRTTTVEKTYTVMVPTTEKRTGTRKVSRTVQETVNKTVTVDEGHWDTQMVEVPCTTSGRGGRSGLLAKCRLRRACCDPCAKPACGCDSGLRHWLRRGLRHRLWRLRSEDQDRLQEGLGSELRNEGSSGHGLQAGLRRPAVRILRDGLQARQRRPAK